MPDSKSIKQKVSDYFSNNKGEYTPQNVNKWITYDALSKYFEDDPNAILTGDPGGAPTSAILPMAQCSPKLLSKLASKFGITNEIPAIRSQIEEVLGESHPGRGGRFWSGPGGYSPMYNNLNTSSMLEGGPNIFRKTIEAKNPLILQNITDKDSSLLRAASKLDPIRTAAIRKYFETTAIPNEVILGKLTGLPNNQIREALSHNSSFKQNILQERLGAELVKKYGYDTVLGISTRNHVTGINEIVELLK